MAGYRIFFVNSVGRVERAKEINCESDADAIAQLESENGYAELWQGARFIRGSELQVERLYPAPTD